MVLKPANDPKDRGKPFESSVKQDGSQAIYAQAETRAGLRVV